MDIESIGKIVEFFETEVKQSNVTIRVDLPSLVHKKLQKELQELNIINQKDFIDEFNITIKDIEFNFVIKK
tara:strand:- start:777 stop:989 length:213 start_codon:yes stop_codon:yes gene_type:complete